MSETGQLRLGAITDLASVQRNFDLLAAQQVGRGPAQARVYNSANISIAVSGTPQNLTFNSERYDTGNFHSTSSNTSRLTAPTAGLYDIGAGVRFAANATGFRQLELLLNGSVVIAAVVYPLAGAVIVADMNIGTNYQLAAGDYVEVRVTQNSGGALNVTSTANQSPEFWIVRLGSQA